MIPGQPGTSRLKSVGASRDSGRGSTSRAARAADADREDDGETIRAGLEKSHLDLAQAFSVAESEAVKGGTPGTSPGVAGRGAVLLTGGTGFIGTLIAAVLLGRERRRVVAVVRNGWQLADLAARILPELGPEADRLDPAELLARLSIVPLSEPGEKSPLVGSGNAELRRNFHRNSARAQPKANYAHRNFGGQELDPLTGRRLMS